MFDMADVWFPTKPIKKFNEGVVLRSRKIHSGSSQLVKAKGSTLLEQPLLRSDLTCLAASIEAGADVNEANVVGVTPLHYHLSVSHDKTLNDAHFQCMKLLIEKGADVNFPLPNGQLPLHSAAKENHVNCVEFFANVGADLSAKDIRGKTALYLAVEQGNYESIKKLIKLGADVNCTSNFGMTPLMRAAMCESCIQLLLRKGAYVNKINKFRQNALQISVAINCYEDFEVPPEKDVRCMLLLAAGESTEGPTVNTLNFYSRGERIVHVPKYLLEFEQIKLSLKWACRDVIRRKMIQSDPHTNLFIRVPKLGIPKLLQSYLLYDMSVDCRESN